MKPHIEANQEIFKKKYRERSQRKAIKKRELLYQLRVERGGKCTMCGYDQEVKILQFHHHDKNKVANVTELQSLKLIKAEAEKCILLCPNCHALTHLK